MGPHGCWLDQLEWIVDELGRVATDCLRFEHLTADLAAYLGVAELPHLNGSGTCDYRTMYTDRLAELVGVIHKRDIEHFGFTFEGAASRGCWET